MARLLARGGVLAGTSRFTLRSAMRPAMPWTQQDYPDSLKNLDPKVRKKAIDIANRLVEDEAMDEGRAIAIATSQAKKSVQD